jgi:hypothetical protein
MGKCLDPLRLPTDADAVTMFDLIYDQLYKSTTPHA